MDMRKGRAFGKSTGDLDCDPVHTFASGINTEYFPVVTGDPTFSGIQPGDIIEFDQSHAAIVASVPSPFTNINDVTVDQAPINESEQTGVSVGVVRETSGDPIVYHRGSGVGTAKITFVNSFGSGIMNVDKDKFDNWKTKNSGQSGDYYVGSSLEMMAVDNQFDSLGIRQRFQYWGDNQQAPNPRTIQISTNATYAAKFESEFDVRFQNSLPGATGGQINVRGAIVSAPYDTQVRKETEQSITAGALYQVINRIEYTFSSWSTGSTTASTTFTPTSNSTYTANFTSKPLPPENVWAGGTAGNYVQVTWTEHPSQYVTQYQIWRIVKDNGVLGSPTLVATLNRGTTSYTDYDFLITSGYTSDIAQYDVRSVFVVSGQPTQYSDPYYTGGVFATNDFKISHSGNKGLELQVGLEQPKNYTVSNFPNPFNPSTTISYQLAEDASVQLKIYDVMGREVRTLVDAQKQAGYHSVKWSGKDSRGMQVSSGVYLYRFTANPTGGNKPFVASGKLLLTK